MKGYIDFKMRLLMKVICSIFFGLLMSFHVQAELSPVEQRIADRLLSGEIQHLKSAAKNSFDKNISNIELMDIFSEILLTKYSTAYPSEMDSLAWVARAIGASKNDRYHTVLSEVANSSNNKKLIKHASKALGSLGEAQSEQYVAGMYSLPKGIYAKETPAARDERIVALITAGDLTSLKQGAKAIIDTNAQNVRVTDIIAEILISYHGSASRGQVQTFSWLAKALGQSTSGRYADILKQVHESGSHRKLQKHAKRALRYHGEAKGEQYKKGMLGQKIASYDF
ncbi:hypothetical protein ACVBE9_07975 [Eionea flava]